MASLDSDEPELTLVSLTGVNYSLSPAAVKHCDFLLALQAGLDDPQVIDLAQLLQPDHTLRRHLTDELLAVLVMFLNQRAVDTDQRLSRLLAMKQVTCYDPDLLYEQYGVGDYWRLIKPVRLEQLQALDTIALVFALDELRLLNEVRVAFHLKEQIGQPAVCKQYLQYFIERDLKLERMRLARG